MHIILVAATSLDGKITKWGEAGVSGWNSREDRQYFSELVAKEGVSIMGSGTYDVIKSTLKTVAGKLRIVMTSQPVRYRDQQIAGSLEFWNDNPEKAVAKLKSLGYNEAFLFGGSEIYTSFLADKLVNELWVTMEPKIFGAGKNLAGTRELDIDLKLIEMTKLNERGTLLLKYEVL